jgi:hypothetical protein
MNSILQWNSNRDNATMRNILSSTLYDLYSNHRFYASVGIDQEFLYYSGYRYYIEYPGRGEVAVYILDPKTTPNTVLLNNPDQASLL